MKDEQKGAQQEHVDEPVKAGVVPDGMIDPESLEMAEFSIAMSLMPDGRVRFMAPNFPALRQANDEDIISLLERGKRQLERMIMLSTIRNSINEGIQNAANVGAMSAMQFMAEKAKGGRILTPQ